MYPEWLRWSRGGEIGSALMLMLWLVLMQRLELADPSEPSWCCCHAAMEPKEGPAGELKPDNSALFRE